MFRSPGRLPHLALLLSTLLASTTAARAARWTPLGPNGGTVQALLADPAGGFLLWAGTDGGGIWRSGDGGAHWISSSQGLGSADVHALAGSPPISRTLWAATSGGIYKSTDDGTLWRRVWFEAERPDDVATPWTLSIAADPTDPDVAWAVTFRGWVLKTTDGGATWERVLDTQGQPGLLLIDPTAPDTVYMGLWKTADGGATWQELDSHGGLLALDPSHPQTLYSSGLWKSTDAGATWTPLTGFEYPVESLLVDPSEPDVLIASQSGIGVFRSEDGGQSWAPVNGLPYLQVTALAADPTLPGRIWLGAVELGVFRSRDSGRTWEPSRQGLRASHARAVAFDPVQPRTLYAAAQTLGVHRSADAGRTWTRINTGLPAVGGYGVIASTVAAHPSLPGVLFAGTGEGLSRSLDQGGRWSRIFGQGEVRSIAFDLRKPETIWVGGDAVFRTRNGGSTWKRLRLPSGGDYEAEIAEVITDPRRPGTVYVLDFDGRHFRAESLFRSTDDGETWQVAFTRGAVALALHPTRPDTLYLATEVTREILRSRDGGLTWETIAKGVGGGSQLTSLLVDRLDPSILYLGTNGSGVWRSMDQGVNWSRLGTGLVAPRITCLEADPRKPRRIIACTWGGGLEEIRLSSAP